MLRWNPEQPMYTEDLYCRDLQTRLGNSGSERPTNLLKDNQPVMDPGLNTQICVTPKTSCSHLFAPIKEERVEQNNQQAGLRHSKSRHWQEQKLQK
ncbi:uncharacterized protein LOC134761961 isoform X4 [Pongo abelii]|uniref:uncharacterized protein LOC134761961 isoform X4 n=1 Tax=Pongo abelii TaxID=9601 RepID=UPI003006C68D